MMKRREFITLLGGAAIWPVAARAQQSAMPLIGIISSGALESDAPRLDAFRRGLNEVGFVEGHNVDFEYRGMQGHYDLAPAFLADLVRRPVAVIVVVASTPATLAAKAATSTIPIVFNMGNDPVEAGIVSSFNRPGGNITGVSNLTGLLAAKRLELLHELMPSAATIAVLANPSNPALTEYEMAELKKAAGPLGLKLDILNARTVGEIDSAFATLPQARVDALLISSEFFFTTRSEQLVALAARYAVPTSYSDVDAAKAGGLMSYRYVLSEIYRQMGIYAGRILKGEKPADLPVQQPTQFELVINLKTAKALGLSVPPSLLTRADEVIE
jgi:putative tryptophan/tyrosine transport system substrate-binding protein